INDILDIERISSGKVSMEPAECVAGELMRLAEQVVRSVAERAGVRLVVEPVPARIRADPDRIVQVMTNLLDNAIKFSPEGSTVIFSAEELPDAVRFEVIDRGRGI